MSVIEKAKHIAVELKGHAPFTIFGALIGIAFMLLFNAIGKPEPHTLFMIFHPTHVILSAMVTASLFKIHERKKHILLIFIVGYTGSIGIATLSDSILPFIGETVLGLDIPTHTDLHSHSEADHEEQQQPEDHASHENTPAYDDDKQSGIEHKGHKLHLGFLEHGYIVSLAAILGILIALFIPGTKFPHAGHVLISTWASSAHILMNSAGTFSLADLGGVFVILFIAVWLPCCISDIVFPLLFVKGDLKIDPNHTCTNHKIHSHEHIQQQPEETGGEEDTK